MSKEDLKKELTKLVHHHERNSDHTVQENYQSKLINFITSFKMEITKIEGKFKLGQDLNARDHAGMLEGLRNLNHPESATLADFIVADRATNEKTQPRRS